VNLFVSLLSSIPIKSQLILFERYSPLNPPRITWQLRYRESLEDWLKFGERTAEEVNFLMLLEDISQRRARAQRVGS
jgi:hypothetical protein